MRTLGFQGLLCSGLAAVFCLAGGVLHAEELTWGADGQGGSGTWDAASTNWWNGTSNQTWMAGATARFSGTPGSVTVSGTPLVAGIVFDAPSITLTSSEDARILAAEPVFTLDVQSDAVVQVPIEAAAPDRIVRKTGPGRLTMIRSPSSSTEIQIDEGEWIAGGSVSLGAARLLTLADDPTAVLTLASSYSPLYLSGFAGGGEMGGVIRPGPAAGTVEVIVFARGTAYAGRLEDQAPGILAIRYSAVSESQTLLGPSLYSGATTASGRSGLILSGNGTIQNSPVTVQRGSQVVLDNASSVVEDRLSDVLPLTLEQGTLRMIGHPLQQVSEQLGPLVLRGIGTLHVDQPADAPAVLVLGDVAREPCGLLQVSGSGKVVADGWAPSPSGIAPPWLTFGGTRWAALSPNMELSPQSEFATNVVSASATNHLLLSGANLPTLTDTTTVATLTIQNDGAAEAMLDLDESAALRLAEGGLMIRGDGPVRIQGGSLVGLSSPLVVAAHQDLEIGSSIQGGDLLKTGPGVVTLSGANAYTGATVVAQGTLRVGEDANLGGGERIFLGSAGLSFVQDVVSDKIVVGCDGTDRNAVLRLSDHDVTLQGLEGSLRIAGTGDLTVGPSTFDFLTIEQIGTVTIAEAIGGRIDLWGGELQAEGHVDDFRLNYDGWPPGLSAGAGAGVVGDLSIDEFELANSFVLTVDIGPTGCDHIHVRERLANFLLGPVWVKFRDAGEILLDHPYPILTSPSLHPSLVEAMQLEPTQAFLGWEASFSAVSNQVLATIHAIGAETPLGPGPDRLRVIAGDSESLTLAWDDNTDLETWFELERMDVWWNPDQVFVLPANTTSFHDTGLDSSRTYRYRIRAGNERGTTPFSDELVVRPPGEYSQWRSLVFAGDYALPEISADGADPDGDGLFNIYEYLFGLSPFLADEWPRPKPRLTRDHLGGQYFGIEFRRTAAFGVNVYLEYLDPRNLLWRKVWGSHSESVVYEDGSFGVYLIEFLPPGVEFQSSRILRLRVE